MSNDIPRFESRRPSQQVFVFADFSVSREIHANRAHLRRVVSSPRLEFENHRPDFGVCLCGPISASRFHRQLSGECMACLVTLASADPMLGETYYNVGELVCL